MSGLLEKDFRILLQRKKLMVLYLFIAIILSISTDGSFIVSYMTLLGSLLATSTITYDENDNGYAFLMTLPIDAKTYAMEKHLFSAICLGSFWGLAVVLQFLCATIMQIPTNFGSDIAGYAIYLPLFLIIISIMLPIELKYGTEKSRIVMVAIFGLVFLASVLGQQLLTSIGVDTNRLLMSLSRLSLPMIVTSLIVITLLIVTIAVNCSVRIMQNKEY